MIQSLWTGGKPAESLFKWKLVPIDILNEQGDVIYKHPGVEVPEQWSYNAAQTLAQKYLFRGVTDEAIQTVITTACPKPKDAPSGEWSLKQVAWRIATFWGYWGKQHGYFATDAERDIFINEVMYGIFNQTFAPNSPQWFNTGIVLYGIHGSIDGNWVIKHDTNGPFADNTEASYARPAVMACHLKSIKDSMFGPESITDFWVSEARLFKFGSGNGANWWRIRGKGEPLSKGGVSSGLMSFLQVPNAVAGTIKSGGTTRRAAKMVSLDLDHPEIKEFITWKVREERKAMALVDHGFSAEWNAEGGAYETVGGQNSNNSVAIPHSFYEVRARGLDWYLIGRVKVDLTKLFPIGNKQEHPQGLVQRVREFKHGTFNVTAIINMDGAAGQGWYPILESCDPEELLDLIARSAWLSADPGIHNLEHFEAWNPVPKDGKVKQTNPCVVGTTKINTRDGLIPIEKLLDKDFDVVGSDGKFHRVKPAFKTGKKPVYRLKTKAGYTIDLTADHKVLVKDIGDVEARNLKAGDTIYLCGNAYGSDSIDLEFARYIGLMLGDGCITKNHPHAVLTMAPEELGVVSSAAKTVNRFRTQNSNTIHNGNSTNTAIQQQATSRFATEDKCVIEKLRSYAILDKNNSGKEYTDAVFKLDKNSQAAILNGLFTSDGTVANYNDKSRYISLDSSSIKLLQQTQLLLLNFGIKSKLYENRRGGKTAAVLPDGKGGKKNYTVQEMHSLRISKNSRLLFEKEINFAEGSKKREALRKLNTNGAYHEKLEDEFESLEYIGEQDVYDLTEPSTNHFIANGIVVHNCSEYLHLENTSCNLMCLNVLKVENKTDFEHAVRLMTYALDITVSFSSLPSEELAWGAYKYRSLGLGFAGLGALLMRQGLAYDSNAGRAKAAEIAAKLTLVAWETSAELAARLGHFLGYDKDSMDNIFEKHAKAASLAHMDDIANRFRKLKGVPVRNSFVSLIMPAGTVGLVMDCDTTGIEPFFALQAYKKLAGGGSMKIACSSVADGLAALGYQQNIINEIMGRIASTGSIDDCPINEHEKKIFATAVPSKEGGQFIDWRAHLKMLGAVQPFISGASSKTINMPHNTTVAEIKEAYEMAYKLGIKCVALYRDGCKMSQPLNVKGVSKDPLIRAAKDMVSVGMGDPILEEMIKRRQQAIDVGTAVISLMNADPERFWHLIQENWDGIKVPKSRKSYTEEFTINSPLGPKKFHLCVGLTDKGDPIEVFMKCGVGGNFESAVVDVLGITLSYLLQQGMPLMRICKKFILSKMRFEPMGFTDRPELRFVNNMMEAVMKLMAIKHLSAEQLAELGIEKLPDRSAPPKDMESFQQSEPDIETHDMAFGTTKCIQCGYDVPVVGCVPCERCGFKPGGCGA